MWRIDTATDRCGGSIVREEHKLDPVWPELEKKEIDVGPSKTSLNNHPFGNNEKKIISLYQLKRIISLYHN
jgi:hypothetical protein